METIIRFLDLRFGITDRARRARIAARRAGPGVTAAMLYDGGLEVAARHLRPFYTVGRPCFPEPTRVRLLSQSRVSGTGADMDAVYLPSEDSFMLHGGTIRAREDSDYWIEVDGYLGAFEKALLAVQSERRVLRA